MNYMQKRGVSALLVLLILLSAFSGLTVNASDKLQTEPTGYTKAEDVKYQTSGDYVYNWGARGEDCVFLTTYAQSYYTGSYTFDLLSRKSGGTTQSNASSSELYSALKSMMTAKHSHQTSYNETRGLFRYTDCLKNDTAHISSFYSGKELTSEWDSGKTWNREHTWPNSKGLGGNDENDIMMLRPTAIQENSSRGNAAYGEHYFDPGVSTRGDCARIVLYVYTRWGNTQYMWGGNGVMEDLDTLLRWIEEDPVDTWEMGRNDAVQAITGVRNVFVDYPEYAFLLFGREVPADMTTPSGGAAESHTITAVPNNTAWGTVSVSGSVITAKPAQGYYAAGYAVLEGQASVSQNGNTFQVSAQSDCRIRIDFAPKTPVTVTFSGAAADPIETYAGDSVTLPEAKSVPEQYRFVGWTEQRLAADTTVRPAFFPVGASYTPTENVTLYALYSYRKDGAGGSSSEFTLLSAEPDDWCGEYVLTNAAAGKVLLADGSKPGDASSAVDLSETGIRREGNTLSDVTEQYILVVEQAGSNYSIRLKGAPSETYLMTEDKNNGFGTASSAASASAQWSLDFDTNGQVTIQNVAYSDRTIRYNSGSKMFRTYTSGQDPVYLYAGAGGGTTYYTSGVQCRHERVERVEAKEPSCTENGNIRYWHCPDCGRYFNDETLETEISYEATIRKATGHSMEKTAAKEPTCTEPGNYEYWKCATCGKYFKDSAGAEEFAGESYLRGATGHSMEKTEAKEPTCTEPGNYEYWKCSKCGSYFKDQAGKEAYAEDAYLRDATGHSLTETPAKAPTDEEPGNIRFWRCANCGKYFRDDAGEEEIDEQQTVIPPLSHQHVLQETPEKPATCTENGNIRYWYCSVCQKYFRDAAATDEISSGALVIEATGHDLERITAKEPTCEEPGNYEYWRCTKCGTCFHDPAGAEAYDGQEYLRETVGHVLRGTEANPATCTKAGNTAYWHCSVCGEYFRDAAGNEKTTFAQTVLVPLGHDFSAWVITRAATCEADGSQERVCRRCGEKEAETLRAFACPSEDYLDNSKADWYHDVVDYMIRNGYMGGTAANVFSPENTLTRGELVTILYRIAGSPAVTGATKFTDVPETQFYYDPVRWAEQNGVVNGVTPTTFEPESPITREQIATILYRYLKAEPVGENHLAAFNDGGSVSDYARDAMNWAVSVGLFNGDHGRLLPLDNATRAEIAAVLMRWQQGESR